MSSKHRLRLLCSHFTTACHLALLVDKMVLVVFFSLSSPSSPSVVSPSLAAFFFAMYVDCFRATDFPIVLLMLIQMANSVTATHNCTGKNIDSNRQPCQAGRVIRATATKTTTTIKNDPKKCRTFQKSFVHPARAYRTTDSIGLCEFLCVCKN